VATQALSYDDSAESPDLAEDTAAARKQVATEAAADAPDTRSPLASAKYVMQKRSFEALPERRQRSVLATIAYHEQKAAEAAAAGAAAAAPVPDTMDAEGSGAPEKH
jgi:hypothetical protein